MYFRQRAWGVPIPVFYCEDCGETIVTDETIENIAKIFEKESSDAWVKYSAEELLQKDLYVLNAVKHISVKKMISWMYGSIQALPGRAVVEKRSEQLGHTPVEMYLEGSDQHRGWFQSSLLTSVATQGKLLIKQF